jgi:uncharacterized protein YdcH (DUF465 family)
VEHREALKDELIRTNEEFRQLHDEHQQLERKLESLYLKTLLSEEDEVEVKRIKREKLRLKDRMMDLLRAHEDARVTA